MSLDSAKPDAAPLDGDAAARLSARQALHEHGPQLLAYIGRQTPAALTRFLDPYDVLQDVYCKAIGHLDEFPGDRPDRIYPWLMTIARHHLIDLVRRYKSAKRGGDRMGVLGAGAGSDDDESLVGLLRDVALYERTPSKSAAAHELVSAVSRSIEQLGPDQRQAVRLRFVEGRSAADVAATMGRTENAVHLLCARGIKELRRLMRSASLYI